MELSELRVMLEDAERSLRITQRMAEQERVKVDLLRAEVARVQTALERSAASEPAA